MTDYPKSVTTGAQVLFELRAQNVELIDMRGQSSVVDWYLVGTCESSAQMQAILGELQKLYKHSGGTAAVEYKDLTRWAVLDAGDIMVHLFENARREEISLSALWSGAKSIDLDPKDFISQEKETVSSSEFV